jgi:hypothetical protein
MSLDKIASKTPGRVGVVFRLPAEVGAEDVQIAGEFNDWQGTPMQRTNDGAYETVVDLEAGRIYRFRYVLDGDRWENDWAADNYVANDFGGEDSVVDLTAAEIAAMVETAPAKRARSRRAKADPPDAAMKTPAKKAAKRTDASKTTASKATGTKRVAKATNATAASNGQEEPGIGAPVEAKAPRKRATKPKTSSD